MTWTTDARDLQGSHPSRCFANENCTKGLEVLISMTGFITGLISMTGFIFEFFNEDTGMNEEWIDFLFRCPLTRIWENILISRQLSIWNYINAKQSMDQIICNRLDVNIQRKRSTYEKSSEISEP